MMDVKAVTPLGVASLAISTVVAPTVAWLVKNASSLLTANLQVDLHVKELRGEVDKLKSTSTSHEQRIAKVEDAICSIRESAQRGDEQYAAIILKLESIPRITTMLETFQTAIAAIVPRSELEARLASAERRIVMVEEDVRRHP